MQTIEHDDGDRQIIHMPSGERYYLLSFPYAGQDAFTVKFPYEHRPGKDKEAEALGEIMDVVNQHVRAIHDAYSDQIAELEEEIEQLRGEG